MLLARARARPQYVRHDFFEEFQDSSLTANSDGQTGWDNKPPGLAICQFYLNIGKLMRTGFK